MILSIEKTMVVMVINELINKIVPRLKTIDAPVSNVAVSNKEKDTLLRVYLVACSGTDNNIIYT